ncbi:MAG: GAF domain-containing sensor histidine kinase, partial [Patescibacteria group bacterium]
ELQIIAKDLSNAHERQNFFQLSKNMKRIEASLCLPMVISSKLIGIIVLGSKVSGDAYTSEDLELLSTLSKQAAIAVDNARLYREVQDFNKTLQQKVDEQTKDIKHAYEVEKQAHEDLIKLDEAKTNFMLVTQHHLRTPLSITMGFLDLLLNGHFGKVPKKMLDAIQKSSKSIQKEIGVVNDLLNVSAFQLGHGYVQLEPCVPIKKILEEIVNDLKPAADNHNLYLKFESQNDISEITADQKQLRMALQNIIDNAMKYTKEGGVTVKIKTEGDKIKIKVKDTGIGMDEEDKKYIFDKPFQRSKEAWSANAIGKGIGVYLSAQIIRAHGGKIEADSEGRGKGSTFNIELPVDATPFANKQPVFAINSNINVNK